MKIKLLFATAILGLTILLFMVCFMSGNSNQNHKNFTKAQATSKSNPERVSQKYTNKHSFNKKKDKGIPEDEDEHKFDHPDKFAQFENMIRTPQEGYGHSYPMNYKMIELNKSIERRFGVSLNQYSKRMSKVSASTLNWVERGPGNVSGRVRGLIVDPDDASHNTWFAASVGGGVWKTTNAGSSWKDITPNFPNLATTVLAMAPSNHDIIYLGTGEGFYNVDGINGNGIFKSTDHGNTWSQLTSTADNLKFQNINRIIVSPTDASTLLTCANVSYHSFGLGFTSGIFKSSDGGNTWKEVYKSSKRVQQILANPKNFNTMYATVNTIGVIKSTDSGETWDTTQGITTNGRIEIAIAPSDTSRLYAGVESSTGQDLFISENAGNNWVPVKDSSGKIFSWLSSQGWYDNVLAVNPYYEDSLFVGGVDLYKLAIVPGTDTVHQISASTDGTKSFLSFINFGGAFLGGGGDIGGNFLGAKDVTDTDYVSVEIRFGVGISQYAHRFIRDTSGNYEYAGYVPVPFQVWDVTHNRQLMVSFRDWDNSGEFKLIPYDNSNLQRDYIFISSVPYDSLNPSPKIGTTNGMVYKNIYAIWPILASGGTWDPYNLPTSKVSINYKTIYAKVNTHAQITNWYSGAGYPYIHADQHNISIIPVDKATDKYRILEANDGGCAISNDEGHTWKQFHNMQTTQFYGADKNPIADQYLGGMQDNGTYFSNLNPNADSSYNFAIDGDGFDVAWKYDNPNDLMGSVYSDFILKSTDGGTTWNSTYNDIVDAGNNAPFITTIAKSNEDPDLIFTTGKSGVWRSDNFGDSWTLTAISDSNYNSLYTPVRISLANPQIVWAGDYLGKNNSLQVSTDGGITFSSTSLNTIGYTYELSGLATDPVHDSTAYALSSYSQAPKILKTTDLGKTWNDISGFGNGSSSNNGFPDVAVYCLLVMPNHPDTIWVGTEIGLYQSTDGGSSWEIADNGLPAVSIWQMNIVGDQVVVATHGRGIWSVNLPWLSGYNLPVVTKAPRVNSFIQNPNNMLVLSFSLRSDYDSSQVFLNSSNVLSLGKNNSALDSTISLQITSAGMDSVQVVSYKANRKYKSSFGVQNVLNLQSARSTYSNNFDIVSNDFYGNGFTIDTAQGFTNGAIQSLHPYNDATNNSYELTVPIMVSSSNDTLSYDDIAIVEPGESGTVFGSSNFYDYVIVEGTSDGYNWLPLASGYDCRYNSTWLKAWNNNMNGDSTMFVHHVINLAKTFKKGQKILIRFRLFADEYTHGWGWAIDNLKIGSEITSVAENKNNLPKNFALSQNYPNPFNPSTTVNFQIPEKEKVTLIIYNALGQQVKTLVNDFKSAGYYNIVWNGTNSFNESVASGVYFYRLHAGNFVSTKKMVFLK